MAKSPPPPDHGVTQRLRRAPLSDLPSVIFDAPPNSEGIRLHCPCGRSYPPPWHEKLSYEVAPIRAPGGSLSMPTMLPLPCPFCEGFVFLWLPRAGPQQGIAEFYGDEAILRVEGRPEHSIVYAFVAIPPDRLDEVGARMAEAKSRIRPDVPPSGWTLHTLEVCDSDWRAEKRVPLGRRQVHETIRGLASMLGELPDRRFVSASLFPPLDLSGVIAKGRKRKAVEDHIRDQTLAAALIGITDAMTKIGWGLNVTLETQKVLKDEEYMDRHVEMVGRGLRTDLTFLHACRGLHVGLPGTEPKRGVVQAELADLVAFMVRRYLHKLLLGEQTEFPLDLLGRVFWGMFNIKQGYGYGTHPAVGLPWHHFFPPDGTERSEGAATPSIGRNTQSVPKTLARWGRRGRLRP